MTGTEPMPSRSADRRSAQSARLPAVTQGVYERVVRPAIFGIGRGDAERAHDKTLSLLSWLGRIPPARAGVARLLARHRQPATVAGIRFPGLVGLAAGMDKDGVAAEAWGSLGFGFAELGTVTPRPQPGNPRPRLFRLPASDAIINRMGFNNAGVGMLVDRIAGATAARTHIPIGVSIGKARQTPNAEAVDDYLQCFGRVRDHADYVAINVSSPNTPGLRSLQERRALGDLLGALTRAASDVDGGRAPTPIFVKVSPDMDEDALEEVLDVCDACGVSGLIAVNTTVARDALNYADLAWAPESGGLSGRPLARRARHVVSFLTARTALPVIGVGGMATADDAEAMLDAGASLLQIFTGFIFHGPALVDRINRMTQRRANHDRDPMIDRNWRT